MSVLYRLPLLLLLLPMAVQGPALAADPPAWPPDRSVIVGTITHNPPYVIEDPSRGIDLDLVAEAFRRVGRKVEFTHAPLSRVSVLLETGKVDAMTTFRMDPELCTNSEIFSYWHDGISVLVESKRNITSVDDLKGLHVGMFPGAVAVLPNLSEAQVATFKSSIIVYDRKQLINVLLYRRLDAYIGDFWALEYAYRQLASDQPRPYRVDVEFPPTPRRLCIKDPALVPLFNEGVRAILSDGTSERVKSRYLEDIPQK